MEERAINYTDGDVIVFEQFGDIFQTTDSNDQWKVQERFATMNMVVLVICYRGKVKVRHGGRDYEATTGCGLAFLPSTTIESLMVSPDIYLRGFGFSLTALDSMFHTYRRTWQAALSLNDHPLVQLSDGQMQVADHLFQIIRLEKEMSHSRHYRPMIRSMVQSFLYLLADIIIQSPEETDLSIPHREQLFKRFVQLLWASGGKVHNVSDFAKQMCITPKYLSSIVHQASGKTPMQMIHAYTANMIAQRLRSTDMSIKEIAYELNFSNESFFGRYVKQHLGYSPKEYRARMKDS